MLKFRSIPGGVQNIDTIEAADRVHTARGTGLQSGGRLETVR